MPIVEYSSREINRVSSDDSGLLLQSFISTQESQKPDPLHVVKIFNRSGRFRLVQDSAGLGDRQSMFFR